MSENPPPLPPRPNIDSNEHMEFSPLGKTPPAWIYGLLDYQPGDDNHQHDFYLSELDNEKTTILVCQKCHKWFYLTTTQKMNLKPGKCVSENKLHHLHTTTRASMPCLSASCCLCKFVVNVKIEEPFINLRFFDELHKLRRHTYSNAVKYAAFEYKADLHDVIKSMIEILNNVLEGNVHSLKINCENFEMDKVSKTLFQNLGFGITGDSLIPPDFLSDDEKLSIRKVKDELLMMSYELNSFSKFDANKPYEKLDKVLGTTYKPYFGGSYESFDPTRSYSLLNPSCLFLGCIPEMDDQTLIDAYGLGVSEVPERTSEYLQAIYEMSKERKSEALEELVAVEKSRGKFHDDDVKEAYKCLIGDADSSTVSDDYLINSTYGVLYNEHPSSKAKFREALYIIGKARNSTKILNSVNEGPVNEMFDCFSEMPVGLDNIGNTCYLNSLLQYYFTIRQLREAVLATDSSSSSGYELDWQSITIGHRKVSKSEVERAKQFVFFLRVLFSNLIHTSQKSISPDIDLAYLALVNAKNDDDEYKGTSKSPAEDNKMVIDDSSPGPSKITDYGSTDNYTVSEEVTVEMEGMAPSIDKNDDMIVPSILYDQNNESNSYKGKEKENTQTYGPELPSDFFNTSKEDKLRAASEMLLGRQQDVTECMDNVMFQLETALKLLSMTDEIRDEQNIIKRLFYGQTRQILHKKQNNGELLTKEESFNHLISFF